MLAGLLVVFAGCDSSDSAQDAAERERGELVRAQLATEGYATLPDPPLSRRRSPTVALVDEHVVVWGGFRIQDEQVVPLDDGAIYSLADGTWTDLPDSPFSGGIRRPGSAVVDGELLVTGTPCPVISIALEENANCAGRRREVALLDPASAEWREVPAGVAPEPGGSAPAPQGIGTTSGGETYLSVSHLENFVLRFNVAAETWTRGPAHPRPSDLFGKICILGDDAIAVSAAPDADPDPDVVKPGRRAGGPRESQLNAWKLTATGWQVAASTTVTIDDAQLTGLFACGQDVIAYQRSPRQDGSLLFLRPPATQWQELPNPLPHRDSGMSVTTSGDTLILWPTGWGATDLLVLQPDGSWRTIPQPIQGRVGLKADGRYHLVQLPEERIAAVDGGNPSVHLALAQLDTYVASHDAVP